MKIQAIKSYNYTQNRLRNNSGTSTPVSNNENAKFPIYIYPASYANINFRGNSMSKLWADYDWFIRHDNTPAIFSFLKIKEAPEVMEKFLNAILETSDRSKELFTSIVNNPRNSLEISEKLAQVLPANSPNLLPFLINSPYNKGYAKFIDGKFNEAHSLEDLLKIRPDWRGEVLIKKYEALKGNRNLEIGNIPKEIPSSDLTQIVDYLSKQMEYGVKNKKKIESLTIGYRKYDFAYFTEGKSDKNVFGLFTPEGKKYVLKMSTPERRSLDNPFALGTLAKIDSYLTYNRSRNSAPLCYYNHEKNFSIYKYIEHIQTPDCQHDLTKVAKNMPDFYALGLTYNDTVGNKNFFLLNNESNADLVKTVGFQEGVNRGEWVSVDNDHVTYANRMQPMLTKYHSYLPNVMQMCV